jgi:SAM-dependent methyltransferase
VEFGCGNGRDSIYLARHGFQVFAGDLSKAVIMKNQEKDGGKENQHAADFNVCDVSKAQQVKSLVHKARGGTHTCLNLYNRFFLHSIDDEQERLFLSAVSEATQSGDKLYMEFRCSLDATMDKIYKYHYRRYVDTDSLVVLLQEELGFDVIYETTGQGMAKYKNEDPYVSRIIAERR